MRLLDKVFRGKRERDHEAWLKAHPDKGAPKTAPMTTIDADEEKRVRDQMESELDAQRKRREDA